jgi:formylglycine-generating enzyme required for sulfatase activity
VLAWIVGCGGVFLSPIPTVAGAGDVPGMVSIDLGEGMTMEFVLIPAGSFMMGAGAEKDDGPVHQVTFAKPFYLGKYEVTQEQWQKVMGKNPSDHKGAKNPVEEVSWEDCARFVTKLNAMIPGRRFSLPSEAQWEYACRAGDNAGSQFPDDYAWYKTKGPRPVGSKKPNAWGLYDMQGNVWEWCQDHYHESYVGAPTDGSAWCNPPRRRREGEMSTSEHMEYRVQRGGSYASSRTSLRVAHRRKDLAGTSNKHYGLRVAVEAATP